MKLNQGYYNIAIGVTISLMVAFILGVFGWAAKMQVTVNKADLALREIERNEAEMRRKNKVYHGRISKNHDKIAENTKIALEAKVRSKLNWDLFMRRKK